MKVIDLTAKFEGVVLKSPRPWRLSDDARRRIEEIEHNHRRAVATAHLYWFD